jgi:methyl-accepting chemotaxis protein
MSDLAADTTLTLDRAYAAHQQWKIKLQDSVAARTVLDVATIRRDDCCELGKWLHSDGRSAYGHKPEFKNLLAKHASFHLVASVVAGIINTKKYDEATAMLQDFSLFSTASADVGVAIMALKRAAAKG